MPLKDNPFEFSKPKIYDFTSKREVGSIFMDPKTQAVLGVNRIDIDKTATVNINLPNAPGVKATKVSPGEAWEFESKGKKYKLILTSVDWTTQKFESKVIEIQK